MAIYKDPSGRSAGPAALKVRGLVLALVVAAGGYSLYQSGIGSYGQPFELTLITNTIGEGMGPGGEVKYRGYNIGQVKSLQTTGYNKQRMTVILDGRQAKALTSDTKAQFTSSNIFGTAAVELVSSGVGEPLKPGGVLEISSDVKAASITGFLRMGQRLGAILDTREFNAIIATFERHADLTAPVVRSFWDLFGMIADSQTVPFSKTLAVMASMIEGTNDFTPVIGSANKLLDSLDFVVGPGNTERATAALDSLSDLLKVAGDGFRDNNDWAVPLIRSVLDLAIPYTYFLGSLSPAFDRLNGLLDRTTAAFPVDNGKVRMNVQLIMDTAPGLGAALPMAPDGQAASSAAPTGPAAGPTSGGLR
ncbi:MlaD family protein [Mycobacteroides abscessus]|uniref:MlaD family protein n=1 Tax=Mycobacteroides abscessus TaxID=36809 RepID=UPI00078E0D6D|nr:MlaD family protein [Mycobacteroides abscessus]AMU77041.1 mammalian cell entry protein [Mycobacteroides abscessus]ANO25987.1 mammalian cell entry protein [Mycobacteroides abscessus]MBN7320492.1 MCE family protein [Mycobacteroides abscessus subsp. massiliense]